MDILIVKAKTPVRHKGNRYKVGETLEIESADMNEKVFELIKKKEKRIEDMKVDELRALAKEKEIEGYAEMKKDELIAALKG